MADKPTLSAPLLSIVQEGGAEFTVQATNRDLVMYEREAARRKWPTPQVAPFTWLTFLAWSAARREGLIAGDVTLPAFELVTLDVHNLSEDDEDDEVTPTPPGHEPG
jgi:hypothetical protein